MGVCPQCVLPSSWISLVALIIPISDQPPFPRLATPMLTRYAFVTVVTMLFANRSSPLTLPIGPPFCSLLTHLHLVITPPNSHPWHVFTIPFSSILHLYLLFYFISSSCFVSSFLTTLDNIHAHSCPSHDPDDLLYFLGNPFVPTSHSAGYCISGRI